MSSLLVVLEKGGNIGLQRVHIRADSTFIQCFPPRLPGHITKLLKHQLTVPLFSQVTLPSPKLKPNANPFPSPAQPGTGWANTEFRSFQFSENIDKECILDGPIDADNATIVETAESRKRRGQTEQAPSREEQKKFYAQAIKGWEDMGLQLSEPERLASKKEKDNGDKKVPEGTEVDGTRV